VSIFFGIRVSGTIVVAWASGAILMVLHKRYVFCITAIFPLLLCFASFLLSEQRYVYSTDQLDAGAQLHELRQFLYRKEIGLPVLFMFLFMMMPTAADAMFYFYTNKLHFTPEFMGRMKLAYGIASLVGILLYNRWL
jgi:predicted MFS family arabinose efflux permease